MHVPLPSMEPHIYAGLNKDDFKTLALRWHPDKFEAKYGSRLCEEQRSGIMQSVKEVFQVISAARR